MTPTFPSTPDALPPDVAALLDDLPDDERVSLAQTWHLAGSIEVPAAAPMRKQATWAEIRRQIAPAPRRSFADRAPVRGVRPGRLRPVVAAGAVLLVAAALSWTTFSSLRARPDQIVWEGTAGEIRSVDLPDGSTVQLDPGAVLRFAGDGRTYSLVGTATFDVAHDAAHPFQVHTARVDVTVLGTQFTIRSGGPEETRVMVHRGRVAVTDAQDARVELGRGQQVIAAEKDHSLVVRPLPAEEEAVFTFHDAPLADVLREVELLFGTRVAFPATLAGERITITRHGPLDVDGLLQSVCAPLQLRYRATPAGFEVYRPE